MRTPPLPRRPVDASGRPSQLDIIAEVNADAARQHRGRLALYAAGASAAVLLGAALWWLMQGRALQAPATPAGSAAVGHSPSVTSAAAEQPGPGPATAPATAAAESAPEALAPTEVTAAAASAADDRARKARARRESEVRAAAELQMAQARLQLEAQDRQQREAEREAQQVRVLVDAAGRRAAAQVRDQPPVEPQRGVRERCLASGNIVSEFLCHSRECRKPEHASDALCTRLREIEEARRHSGQ